ncbi:muscle LIM protein Mlp84B-like isoform X1 [Neocloeon triangulifer]|uniref:muscle LIM protein Mlp84B-like isoform X1 n=1 Tax=Neocloeon triangulifer TaxID=2078957 RepID=UPI00286EF8BA|nr:muscle LIM protein Mlp84B-like isoform X1 [Neocloeon triangulifer]XP_059468799.1 muscle LIM protein Mlp84B-like isoform X1 [Neocloeon triangulifer]
MPFKPVEHPKCPKCGKSVYAAEERVAGGLKFHKMCFKCGLCNKLLDSTNCTEHEGELFCKVCHARKYGPKGYGFGGGAGCLSMDTGEHLEGKPEEATNGHTNGVAKVKTGKAKAAEGEGCPRCGCIVYAAEQMLARGRGWQSFYCPRCSPQLMRRNLNVKPVPSRSTDALPTILQAMREKHEVQGRDTFRPPPPKVCYGKRFGPKGYGYGQGAGALQCDVLMEDGANAPVAPKTTLVDTTSIKAPPGQGCPRCGGSVFAAEQVLAKGSMWHRKCFKCRDCTKTLDSVLACDGPDKDVYCKTCYGKKWGPHGYGFACGSGFLQTDGLNEAQISQLRPFYNPNTTSIKAPEGQGCPRCGGMVYAAEQQLAKGTMWHKKCFNCCQCHRPLDSILACDGPDKEIYCKACYGKNFGPKGFGYGHSPTLFSASETSTAPRPNVQRSGPQAPEGQGCPRCGQMVYAAEQMNSKNRIWHRRCFTCGDCNRSLDSTTLNDSPDGNIYCKSCYGRRYGPKGVGYGMGAGVLSMA